jgi:hypothetical protein
MVTVSLELALTFCGDLGAALEKAGECENPSPSSSGCKIALLPWVGRLADAAIGEVHAMQWSLLPGLAQESGPLQRQRYYDNGHSRCRTGRPDCGCGNSLFEETAHGSRLGH